MRASRRTRMEQSNPKRRSRVQLTAVLFLAAFLTLAFTWPGEDWQAIRAVVTTPFTPSAAPIPSAEQPPLPPEPLEPLDPVLDPYLPLFEAARLIDAGSFSQALSLLDDPPPDGYRLYQYHLLRARAQLSLREIPQARSDAERAHQLATGPEKVDSAVLLATLRQAEGDFGGAADLLLELIPSGDLLFAGPLRNALIERLKSVADGLNVADAADRERLMEVGDLFYRYGHTHEGIAIFTRQGWPEPPGIDLSYQRIRARAFLGETDEAIDELEQLAQSSAPADAAWLHSLRVAYLRARGREEEAEAAYETIVALGAGTYSGGMAAYRLAEPLLDADQVEPAQHMITQYAPEYRNTTGWQRGAWELFASAYATGERAAATAVLDLLEPAVSEDPQYLYWRYRLIVEDGGDGTDVLARLLSAYPNTYYTLIARERWPQETAAIDAASAQTASVDVASSDAELQSRFAALDQLAAAPAAIDPVYAGTDLTLPLALWRARFHEAATGELRRLADAAQSWDLHYLLGLWEGERGQHRVSIGVMADTAGRAASAVTPPELLKGLYPLFYQDLIERAASEHGVDPYFVLAIMREESAFEPGAHSMADARGLMQIIPSTGEGLARQAGLAGFRHEHLFRPEVAIPLGVRYLANLLSQFDGDTRLAAAAYNGGQGSVHRWVDITPTDDMALFVERIPFPETRYYVKKTDRTYRIYQSLYQLKS